MSTQFRQIGTLLEKTLKRFNLYEGYLLAGIKHHKKEIFGKNFGAHFEPISLQNGRLVIKVDSAEWRHEAELNEQVLLEKVNHYAMRSVKEIFFV